MSMIERLGLSYCREYLSNALIVYNNRPAVLGEFGNTTVVASYIDGTGDRVTIPHSYFTGWRVFAYPELGYRRVGNMTYHVHRAQTAYRGLRANVLTFENTPMSYLLLRDEQTARRVPNYGNEKLAAVMLPVYDGAAELDALVRGEMASVVPNQNICIEPSLSDSNYVVLYRTKIVGSMDSNKNFHIDNPAVRAEVQAAFRE